MKIYFGHSRVDDFESQYYEPIKKSSLVNDHEFIFPHERDNELGNSKQTIENCDLVIAEVSDPSLALGIEIGWSEMFNKKILFLHKKGATVSRSLKHVSKNILEYNDAEDMVEKINLFINEIK
ncbi:hypothetical protein HQ571_03750 [Candidatus Kuenenbacteria bacterium]|nr:hypothetical protein [Candidatus Kuenenbacteria bacterium]